MPKRTGLSGSELFNVHNSDAEWKVARCLHGWCQISKQIDIATGMAGFVLANASMSSNLSGVDEKVLYYLGGNLVGNWSK